jgi:hypothetical protein
VRSLLWKFPGRASRETSPLFLDRHHRLSFCGPRGWEASSAEDNTCRGGVADTTAAGTLTNRREESWSLMGMTMGFYSAAVYPLRQGRPRRRH